VLPFATGSRTRSVLLKMDIALGCFVYLDESGDTGFKFRSGSSVYFSITILIVFDPIPLNAAIEDLRRQRRLDERFEFKFARVNPDLRMDFMYLLRKHDLLIRTLVVDKRLLTLPHMQKTETFYNYLVRQLLSNDGGRILDATLILDERAKGKKSKQELATYLRRQLNQTGTRRISSIKYHESHRDNLLQAVDMASGAIYARFSRNDSSYFETIRMKLDDVWEFQPRQTQ